MVTHLYDRYYFEGKSLKYSFWARDVHERLDMAVDGLTRLDQAAQDTRKSWFGSAKFDSAENACRSRRIAEDIDHVFQEVDRLKAWLLTDSKILTSRVVFREPLDDIELSIKALMEQISLAVDELESIRAQLDQALSGGVSIV